MAWKTESQNSLSTWTIGIKEELKQNYEKLKNYQQTNYYDGKWKPEYDRWLQLQSGWTTNIDYPKIAWNSALLYDMIFTQPVCYEFENIQAPTLLIIGQRDRTAYCKNKAPEDVKNTLGNYSALANSPPKRSKTHS